MVLMPRTKSSPESGEFLSVREQVYQNGFAFVRRLSPQATTFDVASLLGEPLQLGGDKMVQPLIPLPFAAPNTYSGNYGLDHFPFHTDLAHWSLPPRYFILRCVRGYTQVPTLVFDGNNLISTVGREILRRAVVRPRRPTAGEVRLLRLLGEGPDAEILRWDSLYLKPASQMGELAFARLHECLNSITPTKVALVEEGDTMVIDNWRMLHGRSAVMESYRDRHLIRVYLGRLN
jgi:alpha-ketoglutarate-dependent taurine dioxygenase